jgi:GNAT superfamily N-acetyltransferase
MSTLKVMEIELREAPPGDPVTIRLAEAMRAEVEERGAHNGQPRPNMTMAEAIEADSDRIVAYTGSEPVGIGALRLVGDGMAEIKRMYVIPEYRGSGVAKRILEELERRAHRHGQRALRLDTNARLAEANRMYLAAGFRRIEAYNSNPRADRWYEKPLA